MNSKVITVLIAFAISIMMIGACEPLPPPPPPGGSVSSSKTISSSQAIQNSASSISPSPSSSSVTVKPTAEPLPEFVEDCMAGCHVPDPSEYFAVGASSQPADHKGRTTCLECHRTLAKPALPQDHEGRMDPACALCHLPPGVPTPTLSPQK